MAIAIGSGGEEVRALQMALQSLGYYGAAADGIFGSATEAALRAYQLEFGLSMDGIYGPETARSIESAHATDVGGWGPPTDGRTVHCSFCGQLPSAWLHQLHHDKVSFRKFGRGCTLSQWWSLCQLCEDAYQSRDDDRAIARMMLLDTEWNIDWHMAQRAGTGFDLDESVGKPLRVFRAADLGAHRLN